MDVMKLLKKASNNEFASIVSEGCITDIKKYIDTGCYLLNGLISADMFKGIPSNKKLGLSGESQVGKTFIALDCAKEFLNSNKKASLVWFASENAVDKDMMSKRGIDTDRVLLLPVDTVENFNKQAWDILNEIDSIKKKDAECDFLFILDSLGHLSSEKEINELSKDIDQQKEDMTKAKKIKKLFRTLELKLGVLNIPFISTNHVYYSQSSFIPVEILSGGSGFGYANDIIITIRKAKDKEGDSIVGNILTLTNKKNRHAKENEKIKIKLNYKTGIDRYSGLFDFCLDHDYFKEVKSTTKKYESTFESLKEKMKNSDKVYTHNEKDFFTTSDVENNPEKIFTEKVLKDINENLIKKVFSYGEDYVEPKKKDDDNSSVEE